ncbi:MULTISPECIES: hypothetical protein [unclassified Crossiella]|uniref:hypothetical protein n=1 Tax=unclassified Crossiella TaxID=2620835 RepID=UPI001FFE66D8|nr:MULTISPECIES: hypothetical protein [unclassified Crossiella]MCK2237729.1 hypothetical protein [Crossiella sp. S99.2]MCK2255015.1 hypothetical protein [Crossiella sp. S99.1]
MQDPSDDTLPTTADVLNLLFRKVLKPNGREYSNVDVATAMRAVGVDVTSAYISQLRSGARKDPRISYCDALARVFNVPAAVFVCSVEYAQLAYRLETPVRSVLPVPRPEQHAMLRTFDTLGPKGQELILGLLNQVKEIEREPGRGNGADDV